jgi:hypothetical protein
MINAIDIQNKPQVQAYDLIALDDKITYLSFVDKIVSTLPK